MNKMKQINVCTNCGKELKKYRKSKTGLCVQCYHKHLTEQAVPSKQQLLKDIQQLHTITAISKKYNKSFSAIQNWFSKYNLGIQKEEKQLKQYYCQTCNQYFPNQNQYMKHRRIHPHKCKYCGQIFDKTHLSIHMLHCELNPKKEQFAKKAKQNKRESYKLHYKQINKKISQNRKQWLKEHPDDPWRSQTSKPCQQLKQFLKQNGINFIPQYTDPENFEYRLYAIDIAILDKKIAIEVNGNQHYSNVKNRILTPYHQERHDIIERAGWQVLEIHYKETFNKEFRQQLLNYIENKNIM